MSLSLTTRPRQQTSTKWTSSSTQQHLKSQHHLSQHHQDIISSKQQQQQHSIRHHHQIQQPVRKQRSFIEPSSHLSNNNRLSSLAGRNYLSRGLSVGRSHDIQQRSYHQNKQILKKHHISHNSQTDIGKLDKSSLKSEDLIKKNITACGQSGELLRNSRRLQAWSSTSSILKSLDKELSQLNGVIIGKCKDSKTDGDYVDTATKTNKIKTDSVISTSSQQGTHIIKKSSKPEPNKVNLSIVLSHALNASKEENDCMLSDHSDEEDSDDVSTDSGKVINFCSKSKDNKKSELASSKPSTTTSNLVPAQQRRALYHTSRLSSNLALSSNTANNNTTLNTGIQNPQNFNASPSLTVQKRPPLVRAMSAPVRSFDESSKGSFLANKRKSRRRKLNTRQISCDKDSDETLITKDLNFDSKTNNNNKKVLTRSKSVAPDVITLVSLISSEGSDSEKEDSLTTPTNSDTSSSPTRRAPSLRKTGKSVSFQENYPPTFQFASKEYSHMLRRGSIAPLAQRIKANRPPTAPPGSIFHPTNKLNNEMNETKESLQEKENQIENLNYSTTSSTQNSNNNVNKTLEEEYEYPDYVRSLKERECWKLYMKMSTKGVSITYDTILRGMLTPTEFRQLQKQRELEEAKAMKENEEANAAMNEEKPKGATTAIERLSESLLKN